MADHGNFEQAKALISANKDRNETLKTLLAESRYISLSTRNENRASLKIKAIFSEIKRQGHSKQSPFSIGSVGKDVIEFAKNNNIALGSKNIYISYKFIAHALRTTIGDKRVSQRDIEQFPINKRYMAKYYDGTAFIFTDYKIKFVIHPNYKLKLGNKKTMAVNLITAGKVTDANEFKLPKYKKI